MPGDCAGHPVGTALSTRREGTWGLSWFGVLPQAREEAVARELLAATLSYGRSCLRGIICAPDDPRATPVESGSA